MVSPREIFRLTCRFSPSAVSRSALMRALLLADVHPAVGIADQLCQGRTAGQDESDRAHQRALAHAVVAEQQRPFPRDARARLQRQRQRSDTADVGAVQPLSETWSVYTPERTICSIRTARSRASAMVGVSILGAATGSMHLERHVPGACRQLTLPHHRAAA